MTLNAEGGLGGGSGRSQAEAEVQRCRENVAVGRLSHAAFHLGQGLFHDPALESAYAALGELADAAGSSGAARELFKGDGTEVFAGNAAAIVALIAGEGRVSGAVKLLGTLVAADPAKPWAAAPWFSPELASSLPQSAIGGAVSAVWQAVGSPVPPATARALAPWLALARTVAARPDIGAGCLCTMSALARRLGAYQDAVAWCDTAERRDIQAEGHATQPTLIMLGFAHRDAGHPERAIDTWKRAVAVGPQNADLLLDLADITFDRGDFQQSLSWAERAVAVNGSGVKHRAAVLAARFRAGEQFRGGGDLAQLIALVDLALAHPEAHFVRQLVSRACEGATWLRTVPVPTEAICQSFGALVEIEESGQGRVTRVRAHATSLEAPSPTSIHRARFPQSSVAVLHISEPDPRIPIKMEFGPPLWTYRGTEASATVTTPSPEAIEFVYQVAKGMWADPLVAFDTAADFARLSPEDLLGLLAHMPPPREPSWVAVQRKYPLYWERFAQVWVCVGILHHQSEEPWPRSTRRNLLLRLLFGPEDWTVDAAAFALCVAAWRFPEQRAEIADAIAQRYVHAAEAVGKRPTQLHDPLARVVLVCPDIDPKVVRLARKNLAERQEPVAVDDPQATRDSLYRRWKRRKGR